LTDAYAAGIIVCVRTTINIDDKLLTEAQRYTGEKEKTKLVHMGLQSLIQDHVAKRLIALGGTMPDLQVPPRRRLRKNVK
jgi:Arc/MetJ family transcription regulator